MTEKLHEVAAMVENMNRKDNKSFKRQKKVKPRELKKARKIITGSEEHLGSSVSQRSTSEQNKQII